MNLKELIEQLEKEDLEEVVFYGFKEPHSYRGYYDELAFEPSTNVTIKEMLICATSCIDKEFEAWKGGSYKMDGLTDVWIANHGELGHEISETTLDFMMNCKAEPP